MCDCLPSISFSPQYSLVIHKLGFTTRVKLPKSAKCNIGNSNKSSISISSTRNRDASPFPTDEHEYEDLDFGLMEEGKIGEIRFRGDRKDKNDELEMEEPADSSGIDEEAEDLSFVEFLKFRGDKKDDKLVKDDDIPKTQGLDSKVEELDRHHNQGTVAVAKSRRQTMRRSNVMAKQVISIRSAISLGFVSQLWVDASSLGDVILVEDENVIDDDLKLVGLETLVGYTVITPSRQSMGKVRGYTFNINSGTVESLELDSFGISIIPSSLVSTYALFVDDVLEVFSDTVVVSEAAVSRMQRLTKGFWGGQNAGNSNNEFEEQLDVNRQQDGADYAERRRKNSSKRKFRPKIRKAADDWELPMDYL